MKQKKQRPKYANKSRTRQEQRERIKKQQQQKMATIFITSIFVALSNIIEAATYGSNLNRTKAATEQHTVMKYICGMFLYCHQNLEIFYPERKKIAKAIKTFLIFVPDPSNRICIQRILRIESPSAQNIELNFFILNNWKMFAKQINSIIFFPTKPTR